MYNTDYLPQIEAFRRDLFGNFTEEQIEDARIRYVSPKDMKMVKCVEDSNGEFVPISSLENNV